MRAVSLVLCTMLLGCSAEGRNSGHNSQSDNPPTESSDSPGSTGDAGKAAEPVAPAGLVSLTIAPEQAELESVDGARVEQQFRAIGTYDDGTTLPVSEATFELADL